MFTFPAEQYAECSQPLALCHAVSASVGGVDLAAGVRKATLELKQLCRQSSGFATGIEHSFRYRSVFEMLPCHNAEQVLGPGLQIFHGTKETEVQNKIFLCPCPGGSHTNSQIWHFKKKQHCTFVEDGVVFVCLPFPLSVRFWVWESRKIDLRSSPRQHAFKQGEEVQRGENREVEALRCLQQHLCAWQGTVQMFRVLLLCVRIMCFLLLSSEARHNSVQPTQACLSVGVKLLGSNWRTTQGLAVGQHQVGMQPEGGIGAGRNCARSVWKAKHELGGEMATGFGRFCSEACVWAECSCICVNVSISTPLNSVHVIRSA